MYLGKYSNTLDKVRDLGAYTQLYLGGSTVMFSKKYSHIFNKYNSIWGEKSCI